MKIQIHTDRESNLIVSVDMEMSSRCYTIEERF